MKTSDLKKYLQRIPDWPKQAQGELVRSMVKIEHRYSERYHVDDDERAALERSSEDVRKNRLATDDDVHAVILNRRQRMELIMGRITMLIAFLVGLIVPALAQKVEIDAVNAKFMEFFNKGDFTGVASLYTDDATAFPPGSAMVKGSAAIGAMWKSMAEQVSDPKLTTSTVA